MLLVVLAVLFGTIGLSLSQLIFITPSSRADWVPILEVSKLQAPDSSQSENDLIGYASEYFYRVFDVRQALRVIHVFVQANTAACHLPCHLPAVM